jgi:hypothetical protein
MQIGIKVRRMHVNAHAVMQSRVHHSTVIYIQTLKFAIFVVFLFFVVYIFFVFSSFVFMYILSIYNVPPIMRLQLLVISVKHTVDELTNIPVCLSMADFRGCSVLKVIKEGLFELELHEFLFILIQAVVLFFNVPHKV